MAGGFSFPPPPPPPPRAESTDQDYGAYQERNDRPRGGRGGRGNPRGRGGLPQRGGFPQRGRGGFNSSYSKPNGRDEQGPYGNSGHFNQNLVPQQHQQYSQPAFGQQVYAPAFQQQGSSPAFQQQVFPPALQQPAVLSNGAYVNPAFQSYTRPESVQNQPTPKNGPIVSYASDSSGDSSVTAGRKRKRESHLDAIPDGSWKTSQGASNYTAPHPMKRPVNMPKTQVAPAVPSFGGPLLPMPSKAAPASSSSRHPQRKPGKPSGLGLIPRNETLDEGEEEGEDVDEEAAYGAKESGPIVIEFNGVVSNLNSSADLKAWVEERKQRWPSQRRIEEKKQEVRARMDERKRIEQETRAAALGSRPAPETPARFQQDRPNQAREQPARESQRGKRKQRKEKAEDMDLDRTRSELEKQMKKVEELQRRLAESEKAKASPAPPSNPITTSAPTQGTELAPNANLTEVQPEVTLSQEPLCAAEEPTEDPSKDQRSASGLLIETIESEEKEQIMRSSATLISEQVAIPEPTPNEDKTPTLIKIDHENASDSSDSSSAISSSDFDSSDSDSAPEVEDSKGNNRPVIQTQPLPDNRKICNAYLTTGRCRYGDKCYYRHALPERGSAQAQQAKQEAKPQKPQKEVETPKRKSLFQLMVEKEEEQENQLALQAIKYLGKVGFFGKSTEAEEGEV